MQLKHLSYYKPCLLKLPIPRTLAYVKLAWSQLLAWRMDHSKLYQIALLSLLLKASWSLGTH